MVSGVAGAFLWRECPYGHCLAVCSNRTPDDSFCIERQERISDNVVEGNCIC